MITCPKCASTRIATDGRCLDCWHDPNDWLKGYLVPVTTRIAYEPVAQEEPLT